MYFSSDEVINYLNLMGYSYRGSSTGSVVRGLCPNPMHNDRNIGSFVIWLDGGLCKCYSCGWTGDFIKFVQILRGYTFRETLNFLGKNNGDIISVNFKKNNNSKNSVSSTENILINRPGFPAPGRNFSTSEFQYLISRGYTDQYINEFGLYYCDKALYSYYNPKTNEEEIKWLYDYMILPVGNLWEARDIQRNKSGKPKILYPKYSAINETIFNLENLNKNEPLYLTEGAGSHPKIWTHISKNSSFVFGANLSDTQIEILSDFDLIFWIPDNDEAGLNLVFQIYANFENSKILDVPLDDSDDMYVSCIQSAKPIEPIKYILRKHNLVYS